MKSLCLIRWTDLPSFDQLPSWINSKEEVFHQVRYDLQIRVSWPSIDFAIYYDGKRVASQSVDVDFSESGTTFRPMKG